MSFFKLKFITPICFLIFFMPFLKMCGGKVETVETNRIEVNSISIVPTADVNLNAYQMGRIFFEALFDGKLEAKDFNQDAFAMICYSFIIFISILMVILSFLNKLYMVKILAILNIVLLIISIVLLIKSGFITEYSDVKYGLYVFLIYSILLIEIGRKEILELK